jgi:hypothetical protein
MPPPRPPSVGSAVPSGKLLAAPGTPATVAPSALARSSVRCSLRSAVFDGS